MKFLVMFLVTLVAGVALVIPVVASAEGDRTLSPPLVQRGIGAVLTPDTMGKHGFSIRCKFIDHTITEGARPARPTGLVLVQVAFDPEKGQAISKIESATLQVREGDKILLHVPVRTSSYPRGRGISWIQFSIHKEMLAKAHLVLDEGGEGRPASFCVDLHTFYKADEKVGGDLLLRDNLVEAKVTKVLAGGGRYRATSEVTHVFKGASDLVGKTFEMTANASGESVLGAAAFTPPLRVGDRVIWLLRREEGTLHHVPEGVQVGGTRHLGIVRLPQRESKSDGDSAYAEALAWAKAVERTVKAPADNRFELLRQFAEEGTRSTALWAMEALAQGDHERSVAWLRAFLQRKDAAVWRKTLADQVLARIAETEWSPSPERLRLFQTWVGETLSTRDVEELLRSLDLMAQHPPFPSPMLTALLDRFSKSPRLSAKDREWLDRLRARIR